ncbi:Glutamyl-tRNA(Gln) amidotransferase subunit C [uncultured Ruminococcus sp.]|uniref:Aspartyl/glutamyl-tRNA(Asn/Gln) amidotransferase subunit C n=1 Tax=Massiliimalia timonensis TaxID=1987501 RepID=A0A8J6TYN5_9FIRM|nr:Asp-tRNA(Asn)/Glu-tRNA(Gln) amidotransferase subunit GatC [Massiliimalia timonensis]MBC8610182.1 Asp-tRNA(Asn)/Glu-tRNA(Gln) amidotransferase subunit GatC [Massiliimalia timonensis]MBS7175949.1 Asp-tRNA(Asn)/Glu-tRNA(Gln) amidotransferase subunit GatC [Clostridiales bacterium]SCH05776.1 Glutamyl-tRNA(Gln) amidotransferase subunit C [uncultured Ruminococcus sp.]SCH75458.1 Glutamyl-tRNA(Gln) amidotransferase subunit C [uncultured Clostridium sp.]
MIDIKHIAKLSRLCVTEQEEEKFAKEMENIVAMIQDLPQLDDTGALMDPNQPMILREDTAQQHFKRDALLQNAPQTKAGCVVVPKVVD